ncbi:MAG: methyltransferase domain-containing protein [Draconibacterium sp.]|nr:methyltransferase domain-containing protein [Draconibacterium sp.]
MSDPFGQAIHDYHSKGKAADLIVNSNYTEDEQMPVSYLFRTENEMPKIEMKALKLCRGKVLDVGAAAGCHSIYLQKKGFNITALEKSELAVEVMRNRGIKNVICADIYSFSDKKYDTILLLMNGTGIGETIEGLKKLLLHLKSLLTETGQILIDSSDIKYLFEEEDGSLWIDLANPKYYGEMEYEVTYKKSSSKFNWLFVDFDSLKKIADEVGLICKLVEEGGHFEYLAQIQ